MTEPPDKSAEPVLVASRQREREDVPPPSRGVPLAARDTDATPFTAILETLLQRVPGAYAAALVDADGETVDYTGRGEPFDLRVAAAHLQLVLRSLSRLGALGEPRWVVVRGARKSVAASALPDGYALGLMLRARSAFSVSTRALAACARSLAEEAGWPQPSLGDGAKRAWFPAAVEIDRRGRPIRIGAHTPITNVEVLGTVTGLSVRERGFRVRTTEGSELTLIREARNRWYADDPI